MIITLKFCLLNCWKIVRQKKNGINIKKTSIEFGVIKKGLKGYKLFQKKGETKKTKTYDGCLCLITKDDYDSCFISNAYNGYTGEEIIEENYGALKNPRKFKSFPGEIISEGTISEEKIYTKKTLVFLPKNKIFRIKYPKTEERFYLFDGMKIIGPMTKEQLSLFC